MTKIISTNPAKVNLFSKLNSSIDITVTANGLDVESLAELLEMLLEQWFDLDSYPNLQQIPIGNYIEQSLTERDIEYTIEYNDKPECKLTGENGNIFNLIAIASRCLREHNMGDKAEELQQRIIDNHEAHTYEEAVGIIMEYVNAI